MVVHKNWVITSYFITITTPFIFILVRYSCMFINIHELSFSIGQFNDPLDFKIHIVILFPPCRISKKTVLKFIKCPNLCFESQTRNIYNYSFIAITIIGILFFIWKWQVMKPRWQSRWQQRAHAERFLFSKPVLNKGVLSPVSP